MSTLNNTLQRKRGNTTTVFFRNFILLIVVPILVILIIAMSLLRSMMIQSEKDNISLTQKSIQTTLETEIENDAITLAHFALSNNEQALRSASDILKEEKHPYDLTNQLQSYFRLLVTPHSDIVGLHFYSQDKALSYHNDLQIPLSEIQAMPWYQKALEEKDHTVIGSINASVTRKFLKFDPNHQVLVVAFAPEPNKNTEAVEMVCLYMNSKAARQIQQINKDSSQQKVYLLTGDNQVLMGDTADEEILPEKIRQESSVEYTTKTTTGTVQYVVSPIRHTDWKLVSVASYGAILKDFNKVMVAVVGISSVLFALFAVFSVLFLRGILSPIDRLARGMEEVEKGNLDTRVTPSGQKELRTLTSSFNHMLTEMQLLIESNETKERAKHQSEIQALQSQINPHFLVNTLNTMRFVAMSAKFESLQHMAEALITILSNSFKQSTSFYVLKRELELLESYIYLMQIRYSEGFQVTFHIGEDTKNCLVPRLLLQPIVENSIVHGFDGIQDIGEIEITTTLEGEDLVLYLKDNGKGISPELLPHLLKEQEPSKGMGLYNVNQRIQLNFGPEYGMSIESVQKSHTTVTMRLPALWEEEESPYV